MAAIVNQISVKAKTISALSSNKFKGLARSAANTRFISAKQDLIEEFNNHEVTKELLQNPDEEGSALVDHGNLVSFLGIPDGKEEVDKLKQLLESDIYLDDAPPKISNDKNRIYYDFKVKLPSKAQINEELPSPDGFSSRSIIELIEKGIGNAASYIFSKTGFSFGQSRSGFGLQLKDKDGKPRERNAGGSFHPMDYITGLLERFKEKFK